MYVIAKKIMTFCILVLLAGLMGCQSLCVIPIENNDQAALNEKDIVFIMRKAGFKDKQILDTGTDVRDGLAQFGSVQIRSEDCTQAIYAVKYPYIHGTSRDKGSFAYNLETGKVE